METSPPLGSDEDLPSALHNKAQSVLLRSQHRTTGSTGDCGRLLRAGDASTTNYLAVSLNETPNERLAHWRRHVAPELPANVGIIAGNETLRSTTTAETTTDHHMGSDIQIVSLSNPGDLTGFAIAIDEFLSAWSTNGNQSVVCIGSLTTLLQSAAGSVPVRAHPPISI